MKMGSGATERMVQLLASAGLTNPGLPEPYGKGWGRSETRPGSSLRESVLAHRQVSE